MTNINMSARLEVDLTDWNTLESLNGQGPARPRSEIEVESLFRNFDQRNLVAPLREVRAGLGQPAPAVEGGEAKRQAALALQDQWNTWFTERELLRSELKRGTECLEQIQKELTLLRGRLEEWTAYERICGKNPLLEYMQALAAKERIEQFLPGWMKRKEEQLRVVDTQMLACARQNGLEHLL
jgi:hypothetical protein